MLLIRAITSLAILCALTKFARAADEFPWKYIDEDTLLIVHADTQKFGLPATQKFFTEILDAAKSPDADEIKKNIAAVAVIAKAHLARFQKAGGRHVYLLLSHHDAFPGMEPLAVLLPLENSADPTPLQDYLKALLPDFITVTPLPGNVLYVGQPAPLARLRTLKPAKRPELEAGLAATTGAAIGLAIAPTKDVRRAFAELLPRIPNELVTDPLNASTDFLTRGLKAITLKLDLPPTPALTLSLEMENQPDAQRAAALSQKLLQLAIDAPDLAGLIEGETHPSSPDSEPAMMRNALLHDTLRTLKPAIVTSQSGAASVRITFDEKQLNTVAGGLRNLLEVAGVRARSVQSQAQLKQAAVAVWQYAESHAGEWPASLDVLIKEESLPEKNFTNPNDPKMQRYDYHPWTKEQRKKPTSTNWPAIWEAPVEGAHQINVAFADGHVETVLTRDFDDLLKKAKTEAAK